MKEDDCGVKYREVRQVRRNSEEVVNGWVTTAEVVRETARMILGVGSGWRKEDKESWCWNQEVQENIMRKRLITKNWDSQGNYRFR